MSLPPNHLPDDLEARRRRGVRTTAFVVGGIALLIYLAFVSGLIGR